MPYLLDGYYQETVNEEDYVGRFIRITEEEYTLLQAGTHHVVDGAVVPKPAPPEPTLEERKAMKLSEFEQWRESVLSAGIECIIDETASPIETDFFEATVEARNTITSAAALCTLALTTGESAEIPTRSMNGVRRIMTAPQYAAFAVSYGIAWAALWDMFDDKMAQIKDAATIEEIETIEVGL